MEEHDYGFYEEPCRFDHLEETKEVADALRIPVAGGEQEFSEYRFRWMIANRGRRHRPARPALLRRLHPLDAGRPDGRTRRACSAPRTCRARAWATSTRRTSPRASRTPSRSHEFKGNADIPVTQRDLVAEVSRTAWSGSRPAPASASRSTRRSSARQQGHDDLRPDCAAKSLRRVHAKHQFAGCRCVARTRRSEEFRPLWSERDRPPNHTESRGRVLFVGWVSASETHRSLVGFAPAHPPDTIGNCSTRFRITSGDSAGAGRSWRG